MRRWLLLFALFTLAPIQKQTSPLAADDSIGRQEIAAAGLIRIGDILLLADNWYVNTLDGYTWLASPNGFAPLQKQNWQVYLDGLKMDLSTFNFIHLNMLNLAPNLIDSVTLIRLPQLYQGEFNENGILHIHSKPILPGLSLLGTFSAGNETGDPGPYAYTEFRTPNVDRLGKDGNLVLDFRRKAVSARAQIILQEHTFTDFSMRRRIHKSTYEGWGSMYRIAPALNLTLDLDQSRHEMFLHQSRVWRYFYFLKPFGREIPTDLVQTQTGIAGKIQWNPKHQLDYRFQYSNQDFNRRPNVFELDFDWKKHHVITNLEYQNLQDRYQARLGLGGDHIQVATHDPLKAQPLNLGKIYGSLAYHLGPRVDQRFGAMVVLGPATRAIKTSLLSTWRIRGCQQVQLNLSFAQRLPEEDPNLWFWIEKGYRFLDQIGVSYRFQDELKTSRQLALDLSWQIHVSDNIWAEITGSWRDLDKICPEQQSLQFNSNTCSFSGPVTIFPNARGRASGFGFTFRQKPSRSFQHHLIYRYLKAFSPDPVFKQAWQPLPEHKIGYRFISYPFPNIIFWGMLSYFSATTWPDYEDGNGETCDYWNIVKTNYFSRISPVMTLDLQLKKYFWHRQMIASLVARNVSNADFRYHPMGASFDLCFYVRCDFAFNFFGREVEPDQADGGRYKPAALAPIKPAL